jgi:nucleotide-binding universal stress UspA family protein
MELRKILVGTDFSETSARAARWTAKHLAPTAELVLAHAIDLPQPPSFLRAVLPAADEMREAARSAAEEHMAALAEELGPGPVRTEIRFGGSAETLVALAREMAPDLIVVGGHGGRRGMLGLVGSTTEHLVRLSPAPVLVARGLEDQPPRSILAPLDASPVAGRVLEWSRVFRDAFGARVTACYAVDVLQAYGRVRTVAAASRVGELERDLREQSGQWIAERLRAAGFAAGEGEIQVTVGDPRSAIPLLAERVDADLIIMGSRGAGAVGRAVLGSVAGALLNATSFPMLIVGQRGARGG